MKIEVFREIDFSEGFLGNYLVIKIAFKIDDKIIHDYIDAIRMITKNTAARERLYRVAEEFKEKTGFKAKSYEFEKRIKINGRTIDEIKRIIKIETRKTRRELESMLSEWKRELEKVEKLEKWIIKEYKIAEFEL